jgi:CelD/BcsL family acetyltransferase involved in cellulose biosynthesis
MVTKLETYAAEGARSLPAARLRVEVHANVADVRADWEALYAEAPASPYQSFAFVSAWIDTLGAAQSAAPFVVVARDDAARPVALLPFVVSRFGPLRLATFAGGGESNFNLPLIRRAAALDESALRRMMRDAARLAPTTPDLFFLANQPHSFDGAPNPLAFANAAPSPSFAYGTALPADAAALEARQSKDARKKLRKKESRLAQMGALAYEHAAEGASARDIVAALLAQKHARLSAQGVASNFGAAATRDFLLRLFDDPAASSVEAHALRLSGRVVAAYVGLARRNRFCALMNSFDANEEIARSSPGELLLQALMRNLCARGFTHFDLGAGEARYKNAVCDETIELCDAIIPVTALGAVSGAALVAAQRAKRLIKQTPWMFAAALRARRLLRGARSREA